MKIGILGAGTWGTALASLLVRNEHEVTLWSAIPEEIDSLKKTRVHKNLPGAILPDGLKYTKDIEKGKISNISFEGIVIVGDSLGRVILEGFDADHAITGVSIGKIKFNNKYLDNIDNIFAKGDFLSDIKYDGKSIL